VKRTRTKIDRQGLAGELLDITKQHLRVEFDRDDDYISLAIIRAIDFFERITEVGVFPTEWDWIPGPGVAGTSPEYLYHLPFQPEPGFTVTDSLGTDITDQFEIRSTVPPDEYGPRLFVALVGAMEPTQVVKITTGYATLDDLPPGILNFVLEATSWFYEYRDAGPMPGADGVPYLNQLLTTYWVPRA
jgi:hypothetical protein